jgi:hypothetical protein
MTRPSRTRWTVALILAGVIVLAAGLTSALPRARAEIGVVAVLVAMTVVTVAPGGPPRSARATAPGSLVAGWVVVALVVGAVLFRPGPFHPAADTVLPMPSGLQVVVKPAGDGGCGAGSCPLAIIVTGGPGRDVEAEVRRHLADRGWGSGCRPVGWLIDRSTECAEVVPGAGHVTILLSGGGG